MELYKFAIPEESRGIVIDNVDNIKEINNIEKAINPSKINGVGNLTII